MDYWRVLALFLIIPVTSIDVCSSSSTTQNGEIGEDDSSFQQSTADHRSHAHMYSQSQQTEDNYAGSIDEFCDGVGTGSIRSSAILRLNFAGRFLAYTASYNNYWQNYNIHTFDPLKDPGWNPQGSNDFQLVNCTVTQVCYEDGTCVTKRPVCPEDGDCVQEPEEDFIVGQPIIGSDSTAAGKLVDIDPDKGATQIYGLVLGVDGFFKGDIKPQAFTHKRGDTFACKDPMPDGMRHEPCQSSVFVSTLENVKSVIDLPGQSDFVDQVKSLSCESGFKLYVKLNPYNTIVDPKSPDYSYGRVVGTIYAVASKHPLPFGPYTRMLWSQDVDNNGAGGHVPYYVDDQTKKVVLDFANNVKFDIEDDLDPSSNLPPLGTTILTLQELKRALQVALELELTTIPPYLSALFSIKDGNNREVAALIKSVVIDEMKHMALVSNILNAIGGTPNLKNQAIVPSYPAPLPGGANPGLVVQLARCSLNQIRTVFQGIERPGCEIADSAVIQYIRVNRKHLMKYYCKAKGAFKGPDDTLADVFSEISQRCSETTASPQTIGAIYIHQILCRMVMLEAKEAKENGGTLFTGESKKQITSAQWIGSDDSSPFPVDDLRSAVCAILDIATEGEGSDPCDPFDARGELSHFFKFAEVVHGRRLMETCPYATSGHYSDDFLPCDKDLKCDKTFSFTGRLVYFSQDGVWPTISNPHTERYPPGSLVRKYSDNFNTIYTGLLNCMHEAFTENPEKMKVDCMGMMSSLTVWAKKLVQTPIDPNGDPEIGPNAAPTFEFHDPSDKGTM
ncbi:Hypp5677 [Branchiostoma lanceolatum]|uniref:Hypp5677 protein n=1 Tax=Branchiostoma lanceolatum TaxID=7740 RepID=A0A8J9YSB9_BRALA|nr:Hypp5677 [Branchiostoma lanceolatum]